MTASGRSPDRFFELMPAMHRIVDEDQGHVLSGLLRLVNQHADLLRDDVERLWDDFFIETCQRWVVPYIGDLVGNVALLDPDMAPAAVTAQRLFTDLTGPSLAVPSPVRSRADVARTIHYRRRKGTPAMMEELAGDVTGWGALVSEFFQRLGWTQYLEHLRRGALETPDLRPVDTAHRTAGPWDRAQHTVDVRAIDAHEGWYNISNLGIFVWRLLAQPRTRVIPRQVGTAAWRLTFSPLGQDVPIFSGGDAGPLETGRTREETVDTPLRSAALFDDLRALPTGTVTSSRWYGPTGAARLVVHAEGSPVPASDIRCANLSGWTAYGQPGGTKLLVDPSRGRLARPSGRNQTEVLRVSFCEGFSADIGGGEYERSPWLMDTAEGPAPVVVSGGGADLDNKIAARTPTQSVFRIVDNETYDLVAPIAVRAGERLTVEAANQQRPLVRLAGGLLDVQTVANDTAASLTLGGLLVEGGISVSGDLQNLRILHCTLVPGRSVLQDANPPVTGPSLAVAATKAGNVVNAHLEVQVAASIVGALRIPEHAAGLWLLDCIVDGITEDQQRKGAAICDAAGTSGPIGHIERTTVLGSVRLSQAPMISESIITQAVTVDRRQDGCVRFSYLAPGSQTPRQYRCQPALAIAEALDQRRRDAALQNRPLPPNWDTALAAGIAARLVPAFTSEQYGRPGYAQLHETCPTEIAVGAEDGAEMGAFSQLKNPQREANLRLRLDEYLPVGLEVGLIHET
jgi:hypothetical protein